MKVETGLSVLWRGAARHLGRGRHAALAAVLPVRKEMRECQQMKCVPFATGGAPSLPRPQFGPLSDFGAPGASSSSPAAPTEPGSGGGGGGGSVGGGSEGSGGGWLGGLFGGGGGAKEKEKAKERKPTELSDPYAAPAPPQFK